MKLSPWAAGAIAGLAYLACLFLFFQGPLREGPPYDDAYITYRYAANLAAGKGLVFNAYEKADAATSLLYTGLLAAAARAGFKDLPRVSLVLSVLSGLGLLMCLALWMGGRLGAWATVGLLLPLACSGLFCGWSVSGMETLFFCLEVSLFASALLSARWGWALAALAACLLTRPEAVVLVPAAWLALGSEDGLFSRRAVLMLLGAGAVFAAMLAGQRAYYGHWIPHTMAYKMTYRYYTLPFKWKRFGFLRALALYALGALGGLALTVRALIRKHVPPPGRRRDAVFFLVALPAFLLALSLGPDGELHRYALPCVPLLAMASALAVSSLRPAGRSDKVLLVLGLAAGTLVSVASLPEGSEYFQNLVPHQQVRLAMGRWLEAQATAGSMVLSSDLGAIAYAAASHDFIDANGLVSVQPMECVANGAWPSFLEWIREKKPLYVADSLHDDGTPSACHVLQHPLVYFKGACPFDSGFNWQRLAPKPLLISPPVEGATYGVFRLDWTRNPSAP